MTSRTMHLEEAAPSQGEHAALPPRLPPVLPYPPRNLGPAGPPPPATLGCWLHRALAPGSARPVPARPHRPLFSWAHPLDLRPSPARSVTPHTDQVIPCPFRGLCLLCSRVRFPEGGAMSLCFLPGTSETCTEICGQMNE